MTCGIYVLTNTVNGKCYVGQSRNIEKRWKAYRKLQCQSQRRIYRAIKLYGIDAFTFSVIEECAVDDLNTREIHHIERLQSVLSGYNLDHGPGMRSYETKQKMSVARSKQVMTEETKQRISASLKGRAFSDEHRSKISEAKKGQKKRAGARHAGGNHRHPAFASLEEVIPGVGWVQVPEFSRFWISVYGDMAYQDAQGKFRLKSLPTKAHGQKLVSLTNGPVSRSVNLIRLMAEVFLTPPSPDHRCVVVLDGDVSNVHPTNLSWSVSQNRPPKSEETRRKLSEAHKGKVFSEEHRRNLGAAKRGKPLSEEHCRKLSDAHKGRKHSEETKQKIGEANRRRVWTEESRQKLAASRKAQHLADNTHTVP